jgi:hypothetical protein
VTLQKYLSLPSLVITYLKKIPTPSIKLKLGLQIGGRLLIANQQLDQSENGSRSE